ncbi:MAG: chemotaxis protein CheW [Deltaproteobacteria bacterium]|nr:chemotaxis protein CheW [Deltaproteobacteria bacterium]
MNATQTHFSKGLQATRSQLLTFRLGTEEYAIDVLKVQEIKGFSHITQLPNVPDHIKGVMNLRGTVIPVIDLRLKFGLPAAPYDRFTLIVVINVAGKTVGFVVDAVNAVVSIPTSEISAPPDLASSLGEQMISAMAHIKDRLVLLLNIETVVSELASAVALPEIALQGS